MGVRAHAVRGPRIIRRRRRAHPARRTQPRRARVQARRPAARDNDRTRGTELDLSGEGRWILNPGSVGQPRDGDARAAYLLIDEEAERADYRRIEYPFERTQEEIRERGLPEPLAERLAAGSRSLPFESSDSSDASSASPWSSFDSSSLSRRLRLGRRCPRPGRHLASSKSSSSASSACSSCFLHERSDLACCFLDSLFLRCRPGRQPRPRRRRGRELRRLEGCAVIVVSDVCREGGRRRNTRSTNLMEELYPFGGTTLTRIPHGESRDSRANAAGSSLTKAKTPSAVRPETTGAPIVFEDEGFDDAFDNLCRSPVRRDHRRTRSTSKFFCDGRICVNGKLFVRITNLDDPGDSCSTSPGQPYHADQRTGRG